MIVEIREAKEVVRGGLAWANWTEEQQKGYENCV